MRYLLGYRVSGPCRAPVGSGGGRRRRVVHGRRLAVLGPHRRTYRVLPAERLVDLEQHLLLPLGQPGIGQDCRGDVRVTLALVEDAGVDVQLLGGDAQTLGDLLQDLRARLPEAALDLRQVRVADAGEPSELTQ